MLLCYDQQGGLCRCRSAHMILTIAKTKVLVDNGESDSKIFV